MNLNISAPSTSEKQQLLEKIRIKKILINLTKILISVVLLYFVFKKIPFLEVATLWKQVNFVYLIIAAVFFFISQILSTKRLEFYLKANHFNLSFRSNLELYFLGMFYNFFIPGGIGGDAYKVYLLHKKFNWSAKKVTSALFNDRLSGLLAICVLILIFSINLLRINWLPFIIASIILGITFAYLIIKKLFKTYLNIFFITFGISILVQILQVTTFIFLLKSLGLTSNFTIYAIIFLLSSVLSLISFAGIGVREMLFLQAAKLFMFNPQISVSASLLFTIITAFFSFLGVIFQLRKLNLELEK